MATGQGIRAIYSRAAVTLHWLVAAALLLQLALGWAMTWREPASFAAFQLHKSIGITILVLTLIRVAIRLARPPIPHEEPGWQGRLASAVHAALYLFMVAAPLTGWLLVSSAKVRIPTLIFTVVPWPHLPVSTHWAPVAGQAHSIVVWLGAGLIALHVAGAVRHHLILRDQTLRRMLPAVVPAFAPYAGVVALVGLGITLPALLGTSPPRAAAAPIPQQASKLANVEPAVASTDEAMLVEEGENAADGNDITTNLAAVAPEADTESPDEPVDWAIQPGGKLSISVGMEGGGSVDGHFTDWKGMIRFAPETAKGMIRIEIRTASLSMDDSGQQAMATGDGYLESAQFPAAVFTASDFTRLAPSRYRANGSLTLRGATRKQTVDFTLAGSGDRRTATGTADIVRAAFGVGGVDDGYGIAPKVAVSFRFDARAQ